MRTDRRGSEDCSSAIEDDANYTRAEMTAGQLFSVLQTVKSFAACEIFLQEPAEEAEVFLVPDGTQVQH